MIPPLYDSSSVQNSDLVRTSNRRNLVGDNDQSAISLEIAERLVNEVFRFHIERGGWFIEDNDGRIEQQDSRQHQALPLSLGKLHTLFTHVALVSIAQRSNSIVDVCFAGCFFYGGFRQWTPKGQILQHRSMENVVTLQRVGDVFPQIFQTEVANVLAVDGNIAGRWIVESWDQFGQSRLARSASTNEASVDPEGTVSPISCKIIVLPS